MSKYIKIALGLIAAGIVFTVVGLSFGGKGFTITTNMKAQTVDEYQIFEYKNMEIDVLQMIDVDINNVPVTICESENDKYGVEVKCQVLDLDDMEVSVGDGELEIKKKMQNYWFSFDFSSVTTFNQMDEYVIIYVPKFANTPEITVDTSNANVIVDEPGSKISRLNINTSNASVTLNKVFVLNQLNVDTNNGGIELKDSQCVTDVKLITSNGGVTISGTELENVTVDTSNGSVKIKESVLSGEKNSMKVKTSNSGIFVSLLNSDEKNFKINADTSNADVFVNGEDMDDDVYKTNTGDIPMTLKTSNGDIKLEFDKK